MLNSPNLSITIPLETLVQPSPDVSPTETIFHSTSSSADEISLPTTVKHVVVEPPLHKTSSMRTVPNKPVARNTPRKPNSFVRFRSAIHKYTSKISNANKYAFQVSIAVFFASLTTFVPALFIYGSNWVGITIVVVLQDSFGASLKQGALRAIGTAVSGLISILLIVIAELFPDSVTHWLAPTFLTISLFVFTYIFAYSKKRFPKFAYAGTIGSITMQIVMLDGYYEILAGEPGVVAVGFRRIGCVLAGVIIGMLFSLFVFPQKASYALREELGKIMGSIAEMYSSLSGIPPEIYNKGDIITPSGLLTRVGRKLSIGRTRSIHPVETKNTNIDTPIMSLDEARNCGLDIIAQLTKQMARIEMATNEYLIQVPFHFLSNRHGRDLERARRYKCAIQFMQEMVYPFISLTYLGAITENTAAYVNNDGSSLGSATINETSGRTLAAYSSKTMHDFSCLMLIVMHRSTEILLDRDCKMHQCYDQWDDMKSILERAHQEVSSELDRVVEQLSGKTDKALEMIAYYGFLTRSEACWKALTKAVSCFSTFPDSDE
ncbi:hypothetical protein K7432_002672 [Basidiobolus ranarum]|uniref:DUF2421 domain-containing protein n=1 Tax=Basidiobolus ranarum TaxID=34480 RepID=A0ABR2X146_9FUNG